MQKLRANERRQMTHHKNKDTQKNIVLVVEDEPNARSALAEFLELEGFNVRKAVSGIQAVSKSANENVRAILMDIRMPGKIDGIEAATQIAKLYPAKPIIFTSAYSSAPITRTRTIDAGLSKFQMIDKPIIGENADSLIRFIKSSIEPSIFLLDDIDPALYQTLRNDPTLIKTMDWRLFEKLLADILDTFGYKIDLRRGTKDGGIDIIAFNKSNDFGNHKYLLQAKRWNNKVGVEPVQRLLFLHNEHKASKSCLATTASFTNGAWQIYKQHEWQLELRDFSGLQDWIERAIQLKKALR